MRMWWLVVVSACTRVSEAEFVPVYVDVYCDRFFECADEALLTFEGLADEEDCRAQIGPEVADLSDACDLEDKLAQDCIDELQVVTCPGVGTLFSEAVPAVCSDVWIECEEGQE
ncbi:MAG: hypothetical protein AAF211_30825 [Myxococcota bacterium]